jgi:hypothetical protein
VQVGGEVRLRNLLVKLPNGEQLVSHETIKVIATRRPTSFDLLQLPKLEQGSSADGPRALDESPLGLLLQQVRRIGVRDLVVDGSEGEDDWTTAQLELAVLAEPQQRRLPAGEKWVALHNSLVTAVQKPVDFEGELWLGHASGPARAALPLPPGLQTEAAQQFFRPLPVAEGVDAPLVLGITASPDQLQAIKAGAPLRLEAVVADEPGLAGLAAVAFDGEHYFMVGRPVESPRSRNPTGSQRLAVEIDFLPAPEAVDPALPERSLGRMVRLYLYKIFTGTLPKDAGLQQVKIVAGKALYSPVNAKQVARASKVALLIHGFASTSDWLVEKVWPWLYAECGYDLCLTYNYDTVGAGMRVSAEDLVASLQRLDIGPRDTIELDIFTYGMGALVARALIELYGGSQYVDRLIMGGPPNAGTPLAKGRTLLPWMANIMVNVASSIPPALVAHWLLGTVTDSAKAIVDLAPDSDFYRMINDPRRPPVTIPYYVQAGDNSAAYQDWRKFARKLMGVLDGGLDLFFGGDHDLIVSVRSALSLQYRMPKFKGAQLKGNHFHYFHSPEGQAALHRWLT